MKRHYAAVDLGAGSGRIMLGTLDEDSFSFREIHRFPNRIISIGGRKCWDWENLSGNVLSRLRALKTETGNDPLSVSCDSWAQDFGLLGPDGKLLAPVVSYRDERLAGMPEKIGKILAKDGYYTSVSKISTLSQLWYLSETAPVLLEKSSVLLNVADILHFELCGAASQNWSFATISQMFDSGRDTWDSGLLKRLGLPDHFLLKPCAGKVLGTTAEGIRVVSGIGHDTACAFHGAGSGENELVISLGTWAMAGVLLPADFVREPLEPPFGYFGILPGKYAVFRSMPGQWLQNSCVTQWKNERRFTSRRNFDRKVEESDCEAFFEIDSPELSAPENMPETIRSLCRKNGMEVPDIPGDIGRAIVHSFVRTFLDAAGHLEEICGKRFKRLLAVGGGTANRPLMRELSKHFDIRVGPTEAAALGNIAVQMKLDGVPEEKIRHFLASG